MLKINKEESLSFKNSKNTHSPDDARANGKMDHRQWCLKTLHWLESDEELGKAAGMCRDGFSKVIAKRTSL